MNGLLERDLGVEAGFNGGRFEALFCTFNFRSIHRPGVRIPERLCWNSRVIAHHSFTRPPKSLHDSRGIHLRINSACRRVPESMKREVAELPRPVKKPIQSQSKGMLSKRDVSRSGEKKVVIDNRSLIQPCDQCVLRSVVEWGESLGPRLGRKPDEELPLLEIKVVHSQIADFTDSQPRFFTYRNRELKGQIPRGINQRANQFQFDRFIGSWQGHWVIADLHGKSDHIRTVPTPEWAKRAIDEWAAPAGIKSGPLFRAINKAGRTWGNGFTPEVIWSIVEEGGAGYGLSGLAPHDLRRTCARLCHQAGGELEQIQILLGHVSIETTELYLGCKQRFRNTVNHAIGLDPGSG